MLTFLRKIRKSLIDSGSARKYILYAIGEIALVVIGILIALQINNWNEWRKDRVKEKEVLEDVLKNLIRNNEIIRSSLNMMDGFDKSSEIVLWTIREKKPYVDSLNAHFFHSTRSGGLLFPLSTEGYESYKNSGFDIIQSKLLKDQILKLFEVTYKTIKEKTQWTMDMVVVYDEYFHSIFTAVKRDEYIPIDYEALLNDLRYQGLIVNIKEMIRGWYKVDVIEALESSEILIKVIQNELGENVRTE
jgi:hypothetical protein